MTYSHTTGIQAAKAETQAIIDAAREGTRPHSLELGEYHVIRTPLGVETIDLTGDKWRDFPRRKAGTVTVRDVDSFGQYFKKHHDGGTEIFADVDNGVITAVLDAHNGDGPRWQGHRLKLVMEKTLQWKTWTARNGQPLAQEVFANFIEDNLADIRENPADARPVPAAEMLEIAQTLQATTITKLKSGTRLANGDRVFELSEETEATGGRHGDLRVPEAFTIWVAPYTDLQVRPVRTRFRFRRTDKGTLLSYHLDRPEEIERQAVLQVVNKVEEDLKVDVMVGAPAS